MEDLVDEADRGGLVGVLIGQLDVDFPFAFSKGRYVRSSWSVIIHLGILSLLHRLIWDFALLLSEGPLKMT